MSRSRLIELLRDALRAVELEVEGMQLRRTHELLEAGARADQLVAIREKELGVVFPAADIARLRTNLPLTADGRLHEPAWAALLEELEWAARARLVSQWAGAGTGERTD